jgi:predicted small secreted protein
MDKKYVEDGIDKGYEIARAVLGKTVYGAGEMVSIGGDTISRVGETASSVGEKIEDAGKKLQAWSGRLFG